MTNYICVHTPSQFILRVITCPTPPTPDDYHGFHEASIVVLNHYYALLKKARLKGELVSVGDLMDNCPSFKEQVSNGKESTTAVVDRVPTILDWIKANPDADVHDLDAHINKIKKYR